jgi:hypothetical protein
MRPLRSVKPCESGCFQPDRKRIGTPPGRGGGSSSLRDLGDANSRAGCVRVRRNSTTTSGERMAASLSLPIQPIRRELDRSDDRKHDQNLRSHGRLRDQLNDPGAP